MGATSQLIIDTLVDDPAASVDKLAELAGISPDGVKWQLGKLKRDGYIVHSYDIDPHSYDVDPLEEGRAFKEQSLFACKQAAA